MTNATVTDPNGTVVGEFKNGTTVIFTANTVGVYKITYQITYSGKIYSAVRTVTVE